MRVKRSVCRIEEKKAPMHIVSRSGTRGAVALLAATALAAFRDE
jgi:hypothetical protein